MEGNEIKTFAAELGKLAMATGWSLSEGEVEVYWDDLREFDLQDVCDVLRRWRRESERFPRLAQVMSECGSLVRQRIAREQTKLLREDRQLVTDNEAARPATREEIRELLIAAGLQLKPTQELTRMTRQEEADAPSNSQAQ